MNFIQKHENIYQTRKLNVTNMFPRLSFKTDKRGIPSRALTEFRAKQMKIRLA